MPLAKLWVEGELDEQLLSRVLGGQPLVTRAYGKGLLYRSVERDLRRGCQAAYLRDRDYDYEPDPTQPGPIDDRPAEECDAMGWRWARHSLECYLLESTLVAEAVGVTEQEYQTALSAAAEDIRWYQAARWAIGSSRRAMLPWYKLETGFDPRSEFRLPPSLDQASITRWLDDRVGGYREAWSRELAPEMLDKRLQAYAATFDDAFVGDPGRVLVWFSGKDLMVALMPWLRSKGFDGPKSFRNELRDWALGKPVRLLELLPEWTRLVQAFESPAGADAQGAPRSS